MSTFIVFDSQNQRWMAPINTPGTQQLRFDHKWRLVGNRHREIGAIVIVAVIIALALLIMNPNISVSGGVPPLGILGLFAIPGCVYCLAGTIARLYARESTAENVEAYVKEYGWADFRPVQPIQGLPCFVVNYKDSSIV